MQGCLAHEGTERALVEFMHVSKGLSDYGYWPSFAGPSDVPSCPVSPRVGHPGEAGGGWIDTQWGAVDSSGNSEERG